MSSAIQANHKLTLRSIRKLMRTKPVTQAILVKELGINQNMASLLLRELVAMGHVQTTRKIKSTGHAYINVYELTKAYLATVQPAEATEKWPDEAALAAPIATQAQAALDLEMSESTHIAVEAPTEVQAQDPVKVESEQDDTPMPSEPRRTSIFEYAIPSLAGVGVASICIWISQNLHHIPGLYA